MSFTSYYTASMIFFNTGTKCNSLTLQFIGISTTIDTWATCFDSMESSSGPQRLQIQFYKAVNCSGVPRNFFQGGFNKFS